MALSTFTQQPNDVLDYDIDFRDADEPWLSTEDSLYDQDSIHPPTATVFPSGLTVAAPLVVGGDTLKIWVSGGVSGTSYKVTLLARTTPGERVKEVELRFRIKDM